MEKLSIESAKIMNERFGMDTIIVLGTLDGEYPAVRQVNSYYEDGAFYVITYALSNKMKQIEKNPRVLFVESGLQLVVKASIWVTLAMKKTKKWQKNYEKHLLSGLTTGIIILMIRIRLS